jgi:hypothetical protein
MIDLPFDKNRLSPEDYEIILLHRRYDPAWRYVIPVMLIVSLICGWGGYETSKSLVYAVATVFTVFVVGLPLFRWLFLLNTGQVATPTDLVANITYVMGHQQWPPIWPNSLTESPVRIAWAEVTQASLRLKPWVFAIDNVQLELTGHNGKTRALRVPRVTDAEYSALVETLAGIAKRQGFTFGEEPAIGPPLI